MNQFKALPRNARNCILVEPLWAFFGPIVIYYAPLYQKALGLSEPDMGLINSVGIAAGFLFFLLASPITNRLGRRTTSLVFDLFAWGAAMVVWAFAQSFIWFLVAGVLNAIVRIVIVSWNLLITEDAREDQRATIHGWIYLIGSASGFIVFLGGLFIGRFGLVPSMRVIYILGAISMTSMFILRYIFSDETAAGVILMEKSRRTPFFHAVAAQVADAGRALKDRRFLRLLGIFFVANAVLYVDFYRILFLQETKILDPGLVAFLPAFGALLSMILFFFVMPRIPRLHDAEFLSGAFLLGAVFQALMILMPSGSALLALLSAGILQTAYFLIQSFRDALFMNSAGEERRGELFSLVQALTFLVSIPVGWLAGILYAGNPAWPFAAACILYLGGAHLAREAGQDRAGRL